MCLKKEIKKFSHLINTYYELCFRVETFKLRRFFIANSVLLKHEGSRDSRNATLKSRSNADVPQQIF